MERLDRRVALKMLAAPLALAVMPARAQSLPKVAVSKDPSCSCCGGWVSHLRRSGFEVEVAETRDIEAVKRRLGVPDELASCHTAEVAGYVLEGHVPADAVRRLLAERPAAKGLAVPGMPVGSPGMEVRGTKPDVYEVILFDGRSSRVFERYEGGRRL